MTKKPRRKQAWTLGDVFTIRQRDGVCSVGQAVDLIMKNVVSCAFYDIRVPCGEAKGPFDLGPKSLIATLSVTREYLDFGKWNVVGHQEIALDPRLRPNEAFRHKGWIGAKMYDAAIVEDLLDAYNALTPWDDWHDPNYLDTLLVSADKRPANILRKNR